MAGQKSAATRVLIVVNDTAASQQAVRAAGAAAAEDGNTELVLLWCQDLISDPGANQIAKVERLMHVRLQLDSLHCPVSTRVISIPRPFKGDCNMQPKLAAAILQEAQQQECSGIIVAGKRRDGRLRRILCGTSTAAQVAQRADVPVLLVPQAQLVMPAAPCAVPAVLQTLQAKQLLQQPDSWQHTSASAA